MQWEWDPHLANPYHVGRVRLCFVTPPYATASMEPLGSLDVTQLPGLGAPSPEPKPKLKP